MADPDAGFAAARDRARDLLDADSSTALCVDAVTDGEYLDAASSYRGADPEAERVETGD